MCDLSVSQHLAESLLVCDKWALARVCNSPFVRVKGWAIRSGSVFGLNNLAEGLPLILTKIDYLAMVLAR